MPGLLGSLDIFRRWERKTLNVWLDLYRNDQVSPCIPLDSQRLLGSEFCKVPVMSHQEGIAARTMDSRGDKNANKPPRGVFAERGVMSQSQIEVEGVRRTSVDRVVRSEPNSAKRLLPACAPIAVSHSWGNVIGLAIAMKRR